MGTTQLSMCTTQPYVHQEINRNRFRTLPFHKKLVMLYSDDDIENEDNFIDDNIQIVMVLKTRTTLLGAITYSKEVNDILDWCIYVCTAP